MEKGITETLNTAGVNRPTSLEGVMHAIASSLVGFPSSSLRVRVLREEPGYVWVITADLLDAGTRLVLDPSQLALEVNSGALIHKTGMVSFG